MSDKTKHILLGVIIALAVVVAAGAILLRLSEPSGEDSWICNRETRQWVRHGNPKSMAPTLPCGDDSVVITASGTMADCAKSDMASRQSCQTIRASHKALEAYIKANISKLSREWEVLGGKFYVTEIKWLDLHDALVSYEDGHNAFEARTNIGFVDGSSEVVANSFVTVADNGQPVTPKQAIASFEQCVAAGNPVMEGLPEKCRTDDGLTFVKLGNPSQAGAANPASINCSNNGGRLETREGSSGLPLGICVFPNGSQCEEWKYLSGDCLPTTIVP